MAATLFSGADPLVCNFEIGHYVEHLCESILNLGQWFIRQCLKAHSTFSTGGHFVPLRKTINCTNLVGEI